jgi:DHA1 family bicyclomycin/chloramphenicol resistance-like MFS transporter
VAHAGIVIALLGSLALLLGKEDLLFFSLSLTVFLLGMGLINPLGTAIALHPFGTQAGAASALLGFLQMGCAAVAVTFGGGLDLSAYAALGIISVASLALSFLVFFAVK